MKKILILTFFTILLTLKSYAATDGRGEVKLSDSTVQWFLKYLRGKGNNTPMVFYITLDGQGSYYWTCPHGSCRGGNSKDEISKCSIYYGKDCKRFARGRTIRWKNGINIGKGKASIINSRWDDSKIIAKLTELGFLGGSTSSTPTTTTPKITKKITKKVVKKYELKGERSIALSWDGYEDLIAGTVKFDEVDYKGTLNIPLPNNDGTCDGSYSLQQGGKGTWQIACTNNMGAAGTLKWSKSGGVTGIGRDHNDKKVKFTVSKKS